MSSMIEPQLKYHVFSDKIMDTVVNFQVLKLKDSFYVWIGSSNKLRNVTVAMPTKFVSCGTDILFGNITWARHELFVFLL